MVNRTTLPFLLLLSCYPEGAREGEDLHTYFESDTDTDKDTDTDTDDY